MFSQSIKILPEIYYASPRNDTQNAHYIRHYFLFSITDFFQISNLESALNLNDFFKFEFIIITLFIISSYQLCNKIPNILLNSITF